VAGALWAALGGFAAGLVLGPDLVAWPVLAVGVVLLWRRRAVIAGVVMVCLAAGGLAASVRAGPHALVELAAEVPRCSFRGRVLEDAGGLGTLVSLVGVVCAGHAPLADAGAVVAPGRLGRAGAPVAGSGFLLPLGHDGFGRARAAIGALAELDPERVRVGEPSGLHGLAAAFRGALEGALGGGGRAEALLLGLTIGDTARLDRATIEHFRAAGLSHLLAVSGSNLAIVIGAVLVLCARRALVVRVGLAALALVLYVLVVGPEPSVLRAAGMAAIALVALLAGRLAEPLQALALSLIVVLALRPGLLASAGLQLSAAATAGIVLFAGPLARALGWLPRPLALAAGVTLGAQVAVAPVLVWTFGELSLAAPLANLLVAPAVAPATVLGLAAGLGALIAPVLGRLGALLARPFAAYVVWIADLSGGWSWALVALPERAGPWLIGVLAVAVVLARRAQARRGS
jgi:competence protein ComEC